MALRPLQEIYPPQLQAIIDANIPDPIMFNAGGDTGNGGGNGDGNGDNGGTGTPMMDDLSISLARVGEGPVAAGDEVTVNIVIDGLTTAIAGAELTFSAGSAMLTGVMPSGWTPLLPGNSNGDVRFALCRA